MRIELMVDVGNAYEKGQVVEVYEEYKKDWNFEKGEIDIQLGDGSAYQLFVGEYKFV